MTQETEKVKPGKCHASECRNQIRQGADFLICTTCKNHFHKQQRCSQMTRKQIENLNRNNWNCLGCQLKEANPRPTTEEETANVDIRIKQSKVSKIKIMQFNIDSLLSKLEELKAMVKEKEIDVLLIQETKMISKDKLPKIPGFTVLRQDRPQLVGNEGNRGGGLLIGIKSNIPYKKVNIEIREDPDNFTEWLTVEIPTRANRRIRLTNIYIPPMNTVVEDSFSPEKWPCKEFDLILGDINAHSLLLNEEDMC